MPRYFATNTGAEMDFVSKKHKENHCHTAEEQYNSALLINCEIEVRQCDLLDLSMVSWADICTDMNACATANSNILLLLITFLSGSMPTETLVICSVCFK
jgi:hypothetical protein